MATLSFLIPRFCQLKINATLAHNLRERTIVEFPELHFVLASSSMETSYLSQQQEMARPMSTAVTATLSTDTSLEQDKTIPERDRTSLTGESTLLQQDEDRLDWDNTPSKPESIPPLEHDRESGVECPANGVHCEGGQMVSPPLSSLGMLADYYSDSNSDKDS